MSEKLKPKKIGVLGYMQMIHLALILIVGLLGYHLLKTTQIYDPVHKKIELIVDWCIYGWALSSIFFAVVTGISENLDGNFLKFGLNLYRGLLCNKSFLLLTILIFAIVCSQLSDKILNYRSVSLKSNSGNVHVYITEHGKNQRFLIDLKENEIISVLIPIGNPALTFHNFENVPLDFLVFPDTIPHPYDNPFIISQ